MALATPTPNTTTTLCDVSDVLRLDGRHPDVLQTSVMDALVIFSSENNHPLHWLLNKKRRHVWCSVRDTERGHWITYDWAQGIPHIRCDAASDFDLKAHYESHGFEVIETTVGDTPPHGPLQWNNCVGHVKTILAIDTYALVPNGLYKHLTKRPSFWRSLSFAPGFGGSTSAAPPPPPDPARGPQSEMARRAEGNLSDKDQKRLRLGKYKPVVKKKTLLSASSRDGHSGNNGGGGRGADQGTAGSGGGPGGQGDAAGS